MAMLPTAQETPGTPDFQIPESNVKAAAELCKFPHGRQPLGRFLPEHLVSLEGEIGIGSAVRAADPSPELIQLGQAEAVRMFNDQRIDIRHVHASFNNGGANQNIRFVFY